MRVCVFLTSIDRPNWLTNAKTSCSGIKIRPPSSQRARFACVCVCLFCCFFISTGGANRLTDDKRLGLGFKDYVVMSAHQHQEQHAQKQQRQLYTKRLRPLTPTSPARLLSCASVSVFPPRQAELRLHDTARQADAIEARADKVHDIHAGLLALTRMLAAVVDTGTTYAYLSERVHKLVRRVHLSRWGGRFCSRFIYSP